MKVPFATKLALIVWLVAEVAVFVLLVRWLGGWPVFWLMLATGLLGAWLIQRGGARAWTSVRAAMRSGQVPDRDLSSSRATITSGFLLSLPGFVTDALGLLLLIPATRRPIRRLWALLLPPIPGVGKLSPGRVGRRAGPAGPGVPPGGQVIEGEVVEHPDDPPVRAPDGRPDPPPDNGSGLAPDSRPAHPSDDPNHGRT